MRCVRLRRTTGGCASRSGSCATLAIVDVRDAGIGFPPEARSRLFDPFYTTKAGGTGMGLAICRSIVESHGGSLCALKNAGAGATFRIRMPIAEPRTEIAAGGGRHGAF